MKVKMKMKIVKKKDEDEDDDCKKKINKKMVILIKLQSDMMILNNM